MNNYVRQGKLQPNELTTHTNDSFKRNEDTINYDNAAGTGIYAKCNRCECCIHQPAGKQSILYAKQFALAIISDHIFKLNVSSYDRTFLFFDDLPTSETIYS